MAKRRKKVKKKQRFALAIYIIFLLLVYCVYTYGFEETFGLDPEKIQTFFDLSGDSSKTIVKEQHVARVNLTVSFLDVGQADAILIQVGNNHMLIDAGNNGDGKLLVDYFKSLNITNFQYVVGTHPHEDHIGGLDNIIDAFDITHFYMPDVITNTTTFMDVLDSLEKKNYRLNIPRIGDIWTLGDAKIYVLYTGTNTKDLNGSSIVLKLV